MSILSCAHVHTTYCDGRTPAGEMAHTAWEKGFVSLGFSSHAPQAFDSAYSMRPEREKDYQAEIRQLKKEYTGRMTIYLGIERDYFACVTPEGYDYYIAAVHYLPDGDGYVSVDGAPGGVADYVKNRCGGDALRYVRQYYELLTAYCHQARPPIIGHFDLVRKNNAPLGLFDETCPAYRALALQALEALADTGALLEVNTGAMARGYLSTPYPDDFLLAAWKNLGGEVIVNSDCHDARYLDAYFDQMEAHLRFLGYDHAVRLGKEQLWERFAL